MNTYSRLWLPWIILPVSVAIAIGCGGGGTGGGGGGGGGCQADTTDIGDGSGTILSGVVRDENLNLVPNANVQIYTAGGTFIRNARTSCTGAYTVNMSQVPGRISVQGSSISSNYYQQFRFNSEWYTLASNCRASLSGINVGGTNNLPTIYLQTRSGPPPPPPAGCL